MIEPLNREAAAAVEAEGNDNMKACPVLSDGTFDGQVSCLGDACAWWDDGSGMCSVVLAAVGVIDVQQIVGEIRYDVESIKSELGD